MQINVESKFNIGDEVICINDFKARVVKIDQVVIYQTEKGQSIVYQVLDLGYLKQGKRKEQMVHEAYLVETLDEAKNAALNNLETGYNFAKKQWEEITLEDLQVVKEK